MQKNYIATLLSFIESHFIIVKRRIKYARNTGREQENRFLVTFDNSFSNSLVKISFDFDQLIYLKISQLGTKLYNGQILLNAEKINFPLKIRAVTGNGIFTYEIPKPDFLNTMQTAVPELLVPFRMEIQPLSEFKMPGLQVLFSKPKTDLSFAHKIELPKSDLKLKQNQFIKQDFI